MSDQTPAAPQPVRPIDAARFYAGRCYEIARTPMKLTDGCVAGTTDYFTDADGTLIDRDACRDGSPVGKEKTVRHP
jgi:apolipoprotein D and lipocalin family protein